MMRLSSLPAWRRTALLIGALSALPLIAAFGSQYFLRLHPCELCVLQRWPYGANLVVAGVLYACGGGRHAGLLLHLAALIFLTDAAIALYHVAVEQRWIAGPVACAADPSPTSGIDALRAKILSQPLVVCADIAFRWLGLSMAAWNLCYALAAAVFIEFQKKKERHHVVTGG